MAGGAVLEMWRFPVKSMRGERIEGGPVAERGLEGDRRWGVVDTSSGKVLSAKREGRLLEARATLPDLAGPAVVELPGGHTLHADDPGIHDALSAWLGRDVRLEAADPDRPTGYEMNVDNTDESSPVIDFPCPPGTYLDAAAVHLLTTASLATAGALYPGGRWDVRRFRPTLLLECDGEGWVEDAWVGSAVRVGDVELLPFAPTVRCAVTTRAQEDLPRDLDIAKTVNREHGSNLGVYAAVRTPGTVRVGDPVELT